MRIVEAKLSPAKNFVWIKTEKDQHGMIRVEDVRPNAVISPDFTDIRVVDGGYAVAFGLGYEASSLSLYRSVSRWLT